MDVTIESDADSGIALKLQTDEWEVNVYASADDLMRLRNIHTARWSERQSIQAGESAGAQVHWASVGTHAALMIGHDDETWDVSVAVPFALVEEIVREVGALRYGRVRSVFTNTGPREGVSRESWNSGVVAGLRCGDVFQRCLSLRAGAGH